MITTKSSYSQNGKGSQMNAITHGNPYHLYSRTSRRRANDSWGNIWWMRLFSAMFTRDILDKSIWINLGAVSYPGSYMRLLREYFGELLKTHVQIKVLIKKKHIGTTDFDIYRSNYWKGNIWSFYERRDESRSAIRYYDYKLLGKVQDNMTKHIIILSLVLEIEYISKMKLKIKKR